MATFALSCRQRGGSSTDGPWSSPDGRVSPEVVYGWRRTPIPWRQTSLLSFSPHIRCSSRHPSWWPFLFCKASTTRTRVEYVTPASAVTHAHTSLVVVFVSPAPTVAYASLVTTRTVAPTVLPTATAPTRLRQVPTGQLCGRPWRFSCKSWTRLLDMPAVGSTTSPWSRLCRTRWRFHSCKYSTKLLGIPAVLQRQVSWS